MPHHPNLHIAMEESHLLEENQLGVPLSIYRLKAKDISHTRFHSWIMLIWWLTSFLFVPLYWHTILTLSAQQQPSFQQQLQLSDTHFLLIESLGMGGCVLLLWLFLVLVRLPSMKKRRVIVCQDGLFQIRGTIRGRSVDVVRWGEIESLTLGPYPIRVSISFKGKEKPPLAIRDDYENFDALLAQIRQYSHIQERKEASKAGYLIYFQGSFLIDKPLEPEHRRYLQRFSDNQRVIWFEERIERIPDPLRVAVGLPVGPDGAYFVGKETVARDFEILMNGDERLIKAYDKSPHGQPGLWCDWVPSEDGQHILHNGAEKSVSAEEWLYYLIEHFLRPWSYSLSGQVQWQLLEVDSEQRGTITIENNVIQGFDVAHYERLLAMVRGTLLE